MATWQNPIYNRTQEDVDYALNQLAEWKKNGIVRHYEALRGCINLTDINRIENNVQYLTELLNTLYYYPETVSKTWKQGDVPNKRDIARIIDNIRELKAMAISLPAPDLPDTLLTYDQANAIEENLVRLFGARAQWSNAGEGARQCGTFECGEDVL